MTGRLITMRKRISIKRFSAATAATVLAGAGLVSGVEAALIDPNALLRLLEFYELGPF